MATKFLFNNKLRKLSGVYSMTKSGIKNAPKALGYGKILIIDTGLGAGYGYGAGVQGTLKSGADAVYSGFTDIDTWRDAVNGGILWLLGAPLFQPDGATSVGVSDIVYARAAETVPAEIDMTGLTNGGFIVQCRNEGLVGNGAETSSVLKSGYAATLTAGTTDPSKFVFTLWHGTYKGTDSVNGVPYDGILNANAVPERVSISPEVLTVAALISWMQTDAEFNLLFNLKAGHTATGNIVSGDITTFAGNTLASGGTETYSSGCVDDILDHIVDSDYSLVLCDKSADDADHLYNTKIQTHISSEARFTKIMFVGGGDDANDFATNSIAKAVAYDSDNVVLVHGGVRITDSKMAVGYREYGSIYKTAAVVGRIAGLPPQVPIGFKKIKMYGERHKLTVKQQELALDSGVLFTVWDGDFKGHIVHQGVSTLQNNDNVVNEDATTPSVQIKRIYAQLNKEIEVNAKLQLLGDPNGTNMNTLSPQLLKDWVSGYLVSRIAKPNADDLLVGFDSSTVVVTKVQDSFQISYGSTPNSEITKLFFTSFIL